MDSTVITVECIDELADYLGVKAEVSAITRRAMNGELDFVAALQAREALLEGLPVEVFDDVFRERVKLTPGARTLVRTMRSSGARAALVSGGFVPFVQRVGEAIGFDLTQANRLESLHGRLTGRLLGPIRSPKSKLALLRQLTRIFRLQAGDTLAVGDGANDLPMLRAAGLGVAFRPAPAVAQAAPFTVRHGDLTALLYLQGIAKSCFVSS
jgi:phosphoserine phosphatase